jgi:hypothetical protein
MERANEMRGVLFIEGIQALQRADLRDLNGILRKDETDSWPDLLSATLESTDVLNCSLRRGVAGWNEFATRAARASQFSICFKTLARRHV